MAWYHLLLVLATAAAGPAPKSFKICVPHNAYDACVQMVEQGKSVGVSMTCVAARDRLDCMTKMKDHQADLEAVEPEDMYIAAKRFGDLFSVFKEIRTKEEPDAEFRYEAVVVIRKDFAIKSIEDLRGLKSCHTGVGRNVGYKIPITKLTKMGVLPSLNDTKLSPRENELKSLSSFFSKSCIVGKWSPDPEINQRLKKQYPSLCELCEDPKKCDYPDVNSGYEGALRCLAVGGGDVAFTKVIFVKKFFGMAYGSQAAAQSQYNPEDYAYLCPDASKKPVVGEPCIWAARPWPGYMTSEKEVDAVAELREDITKLNDLGVSSHADWISSVLAINDKNLAKDNKGPYSPQEYLEKAKYKDVIERDVLEPKRTVRICTSSEIEHSKCEDLADSAYSRDIRPGVTCVLKPSLTECFTACRDKDVDIVSVDPGLAVNAISKFDLQPVLKEEYDGDSRTTAVVVVKKASSYKTMADLKSHKACFSRLGEAAGWVVPVHTLLTTNLIEKNNCPYTKALSDYFSAANYSEDPFTCLSSGAGEVAFMDYDSIKRHFDDIETGLKADDYELMCKDGSRKPLDQYATCNLGRVPPNMMLAHKDLSLVEKDDILFTMLSAADLFHGRKEIFDMFGDYNHRPNVLFSNAAVGLEAVHDRSKLLGDYLKLHEDMKVCTPQESKP